MQTFPAERESPQSPLSQAEREAISRYVAGIRKQLQEVLDLFGSRYGSASSLANLSGKALVCATLLEHELSRTLTQEDLDSDNPEDIPEEEPAIVKTAHQGR